MALPRIENKTSVHTGVNLIEINKLGEDHFQNIADYDIDFDRGHSFNEY